MFLFGDLMWYKVDDEEVDSDIVSSLPAGSYIIKVEDSNLCVNQTNVALSDPEGSAFFIIIIIIFAVF